MEWVSRLSACFRRSLVACGASRPVRVLDWDESSVDGHGWAVGGHESASVDVAARHLHALLGWYTDRV